MNNNDTGNFGDKKLREMFNVLKKCLLEMERIFTRHLITEMVNDTVLDYITYPCIKSTAPYLIKKINGDKNSATDDRYEDQIPIDFTKYSIYEDIIYKQKGKQSAMKFLEKEAKNLGDWSANMSNVQESLNEILLQNNIILEES